MNNPAAAPPIPSSIALTHNPKLALLTDPAMSASVANSTTDRTTVQTMTMGGLTITADLLQMWAVDMRNKHENDELPAYLVKELEALPEWNWNTDTREGMLAKWRIRADADFLKKGRGRKYFYMELRIINALELRDAWLDDGDLPADQIAALRALTEHDIRRVIHIPEETDRMAGLDQLGWSESTGHRRYSEEEKVAGVQFGAWTREHQERNYGLILPKAADGLLRSLEDDPQEPDVESHLIQALNEKLREMSARPSCPKADAFTPWYDGPIPLSGASGL